MDKELQQEDTVSADRKERIIFDPKSGKSRKTSSVVSRQNFNNDKYGNREAPADSDDNDTKGNKSPIKFVNGTAPVDNNLKKEEASVDFTKQIAETMVKKALTSIKADKNTGTQDIPFDGPYTKTPSTVVDKSGAKHTPMSRVRDLAKQGLKKVTKEEIDLTQEETTMSKTYAQFVEQLNEYNSKDGVYRHKGTYAGGYSADDGDDDEDKPKKAAAPAVKRGRGRPAGSKSGANQKVTTGKSYGGVATHTLSLPNSK